MNSSIDSIMAEEKKYEHLKKYEKLSKTADDMIRMHERTHREAYHEAEALLVKEGGKEVDLEKLKDADMQEKFIQKMKDVYLAKAKQVLKASPTDKFEEALLMKAYAGVTENEIKDIVATYKHRFTFDVFKKHYDKMSENVKRVLSEAAGSHLNEEHIDDILDYAVHPEVAKHLRGYITLDQAKSFLDYFIEFQGKLNLSQAAGITRGLAQQGKMSPPIASKLEKALEEKKKKEEEEAEKRAAA